MAESFGDSRVIASSSRLTLTGEFDLVIDGREVALPHSAERVLAYLGLAQRPVHRGKLAGVLWPDVPESAAARSLRTALWRLHRANIDIAQVRGDRVSLRPSVRIDLAEALELTRQLLDRPTQEALDRLSVLIDYGELLPGWDDDWVTADRERFRLLRLEALERAADVLIDYAEQGRALEAALAASLSDPLRDSAWRLVLRIHLSEGNVAAAVRAYEDYRELLATEIGVEPSPEMRALMRELGSHERADAGVLVV